MYWLIICTLLLVGPSQPTDVGVRMIVAPNYPFVAWLARLQGSVIAELEIGRDGKVRSARVSGADPLLSQETQETVRRWIFGPFSEGTGFPVSLKVVYTYRLEGEPQEKFFPARVLITIPGKVEIVARPPKPHVYYVDGHPDTESKPRKD